MRTFKETPRLTHARYWFVFALFIVLMALAYGAAELQALRNKGTGPSVDLYRVIFTIWVAIVLLTPALGFHIFSRSDAPNSYWRAFWTFAYLALLAHLYWAVFGTCHGDFALIFNRAEQAAQHSRMRRRPSRARLLSGGVVGTGRSAGVARLRQHQMGAGAAWRRPSAGILDVLRRLRAAPRRPASSRTCSAS